MIAIIAKDMYAAQGYRLTADDRADLQACADKIRAITGETGPQMINVPVRDIYGGVIIGYMGYQR